MWLPLADAAAYSGSSHGQPTPDSPLAPVNGTDYPTNSTPISIDVNASSFFFKDDWQELYGKDTVYNQTVGSGTVFTYEKGPAEVLAANVNASKSLSSTPERRNASSSSKTHATHEDGQGTLTGGEVYGNGNSTAWNGRILFIANGGQRGFVPFPDLKSLLTRHRFAVVGSNSGHFSTTGGVDWVSPQACMCWTCSDEISLYFADRRPSVQRHDSRLEQQGDACQQDLGSGSGRHVLRSRSWRPCLRGELKVEAKEEESNLLCWLFRWRKGEGEKSLVGN